jgi:muramoyltetrapeptide carboxypeptidase
LFFYLRIIAPARKVSQEEIAHSLSLLENAGFKPIFGKNLFGSHHQFSGTHAGRLEDLQWALDYPEPALIVCARGGYGALPLLEKLNPAGIKKNPKWFCGFSDITVIHAWLQKQGLASLHAPVLTTLGKDAESADCFFRFLSGKLPSYSFRNNSTAKNKSGEAEGIVKGGNLSLLYSLMGSPEFPDLKDCILFLEDLDEYLYHIHRMMTALKRTGCFENLSGVVIGGMTEMKDNTIPFGKPAEEIIAESLSAFSFPIAYGFPGGHGEKNFALPLGGRAKLEVEEKTAQLRFL